MEKVNKYIKLTKEAIRNKILVRLKTHKEEDIAKKSLIIKKKLFSSKVFKKAKIVMFYKAIKGEVDTENMIKHAKKLGKIVVIPVCQGLHDLMPCILEENAQMIKGPYGILEPVEKKPVHLEDLDLVIVPGIAFTEDGKRLGRGKGFYDLFLKKLSQKVNTVGVAFDFQILPEIPTEPHDIKTHKVLFS